MIAEYLPQLILAWSIQLVGVLSPGPSVALILGVATSQGRAPSLITAFGVACASIVLSISTVVGLAALFATMADLMVAVRLAGAAYLAWLAVKAFARAARPTVLDLSDQATAPSALRAGLAGFVLQLSNPKAIMFWLAIASVGGVGEAPLPIVALFVFGAFLNSFLGHGGYALLLSSAPFRRAYAKAGRYVEGALGCFFLFASLRLVISRS